MTQINKITMQGFKSFAQKTDIVLGNGFNCIIGPNGSGKCVTGDTNVQLGDGTLSTIKDLVDKAIEKNKTERIDDGFVAHGDSTQIICLDTDTLKAVKRPILSYVKRKAPVTLVKIQTKSGREITATKYHPLFVMNNEKIQSIKAENLKIGVRVAVPRKIEIEPENKYFFELLDLIQESDNIFVPYSEEHKQILLSLKKKTWKTLSAEIAIPYVAIKGFLDKQSINFAYLVKLLRYAKLSDWEITELIPYAKSKNSSVKVKIPYVNSKEFARFLGYLLAEGRLSESNQIWFTNGSAEIVADYHALATKLFELRTTVNEYKAGCWDVIAYSNTLIKILRKFGMAGKTEKKTVTNLFLKNSTEAELGELLSALYSGDGYVSKSSVEITTKSKNLGYAIETILLRLGIKFSSRWKVKIATNSGYTGVYRDIMIFGTENFRIFHEKVNLVHLMKKNRLEKLLNLKPNPNDDLIEINSLVKKAARDFKINIKKSRKDFPRLDSYCYNQCTPSRYGINHLIENLFNTSQKPISLQKLSLFAQSDIYWDEIINIEEIKSKEKWVYDLCIEKEHNFIANHFFVHNSNVMDALCFVLGKSSSKSLRAEKSANLIYNGGKTKQAAKEASVSIYFNNKTKVFPLESDEVKLTRVVKESGSSIYKINDKTMNRNQVLELLSNARINPEGYNIVLQGDIVRIVEMSTLDRRKIIEEIAGISIYEDKKQKAINELNRVEEKLKESDIILVERQAYLKELKKERNQALKFKELDDGIKRNKATLLHNRLLQKEQKKSSVLKDIEARKAVISRIESEITEHRKDIDSKKQDINSINKEIEEKGDKDQIKIQKLIEELRVTIGTNKSRINSVENEITRISERKAQLENSLKDIEEKITRLNSEKKAFEKSIKEKEEQVSLIDAKVQKFKEKHKLGDSANLEKEVEEIDKSAEQKLGEIHQLREKQQNFLREKDKLEYQVQSADEKISKVLEIKKEHQKELDNLKNIRQDFKRATIELSARLNDDSSITAQLGNARARLLKTKEEIAKLDARQATMKESSAGDMAVQRILEMKSKFKGIYGTVSSLGQVSSQYAVALETAAGPRIKSVVVESDKVAADCIKYLKNGKLGIATFLPMNKMRFSETKPEVSSVLKQQGVVGLASDLIKYDPKFKSVFSYVFSNTLVVQNIDVARNIGIGKFRMTTLDGDLTETSGAMHGGFRRRISGAGFLEKELTSQLDILGKQEADLESVVSKLESQKADNETIITGLRHKKAELEAEIIKIEKSLHLEDSDLDVSKNLKEELGEKLKEIEKEFRSLSNDITKANSELAQIKIKKQSIREKINALNNPALLAELNTFEQKRTELKEEMIKQSSDFKNIDVQITTILSPELGNTKKILKQHDKEESDFKNEIGELSALIKNQEKELKEKENAQKEFYSKFKELFKKRDKINETITSLENSLYKKEDSRRGEELRLNTFSLDNARVSAEIEGIKAEYKEFEGIPVYEDKDEEKIKKEIWEFEKMVRDIGAVNMRALEIYDTVEKEYNNVLEKKTTLVQEKEDVLLMMNEIETKKKDLFMNTFDVINKNFQAKFSALSTKGEATLELEEPETVFEGGMNIKVRLTGKKFLDIRSLSGGEKTMTALAFLFSVQDHEPAPFYVLDEVDAALDKRNSEKLAQLVRQYVNKAQYLVISHNDGVISESDTLYGVSMNEHGISKVVSLKV